MLCGTSDDDPTLGWAQNDRFPGATWNPMVRPMLSLARHLAAAACRLTMFGLRRGPHITRYAMYRQLAQLKRPVFLASARALSISHSTALCATLGLQGGAVVEAEYPAVSLLDLPYPDASFDYVVSDQVLEHVEGDPQRAIDESFRVLRPGGWAVHTTCFLNPIHEWPVDLWRFSPAGLRYLCRHFSRIVACDGWGNPYVGLVMLLGLRFDGVPEARWHPLHRLATAQHRDWPAVTWVVAEK